MDNADCIMCVSDLTRNTVINQYHQDPRKVFTVHNAVYPLAPRTEPFLASITRTRIRLSPSSDE